MQKVLGSASLNAYALWVRARNKSFSLLVSGAFADFGSHSVLDLPIRLAGAERIAIGSRVYVGAGSWLQVLSSAPSEARLEIGDGTSMAGYCVFSTAQSIKVGRDVAIARGVYVADHAHAYDDPTKPISEQGIAGIAPVEIADGAWLGENVVVFPGVRIGCGAVVSANSVVAKDVPDRSLVAGVPARVVRKFGVVEGGRSTAA